MRKLSNRKMKRNGVRIVTGLLTATFMLDLWGTPVLAAGPDNGQTVLLDKDDDDDNSGSSSGSHDGVLKDRVKHSDLKFGEYEYKRLSQADFETIVDGLEDLASDSKNEDAVMDVITEMEDYYNELACNYSLANLYSNLYADDDQYDEEVEFYSDLLTNVSDLLMQNYQIVALSPCADRLEEHIDDADDWQDILDYEVMSEEEKDLKARETRLELDYDDLSLKEYTTDINGTTYNEDELEEAIEDGSIEVMDYLNGLSDITTQKNEEKAELYLELVDIRTQIAKLNGYDNYVDYAYKEIYDRDYTYDDLSDYRQSVVDNMVPLGQELREMMTEDMSEEYSAMISAEMTEEECLDKLSAHLPDISEDFMLSYNYMIDHDLIDISQSDSKAPGGFTTSITGYNAPFLYNCADGSISDMQTLIHEFGHYNEMYYQSEDTWYYDNTNLDLAEIHSQGMEMLFMDYADDIYGDNAEIMKLYNQFSMTYSAVQGVKEDEFQYLVYSDPDNLTVSDLNQLYYDVCEKYGDLENYNSYYIALYGAGIPEGEILEWTEIPHTFQSPEYYISYSVSVAAVYELYDHILNDRDEGIDIYMALVDAEFQDDFQETLENVGLNNPIETPRFDLYADDVRYSLGLEQKGHADYGDGSGIGDGTGDGTGDEEEPEVTEETTNDKKDKKKNKDKDKDKEKEEEKDDDTDFLKTILIGVCVGGVIFIVIIIVIIIVAVNAGKKKKAKIAQQRNNGAPMQPGQYGAPQGNQAPFGAPTQPGQFGAPQGNQAPFGAPTQPGQFGAPQGNQAPFGAPTQPGQFGAPQGNQAPFGAPTQPGNNGANGSNNNQ
ncbi:MAG: hypothetical protein K6C99_11790 [Lachnospiraceae bacterium]|nr:hypothetical protein [Lachnospiraceae bacterium]